MKVNIAAMGLEIMVKASLLAEIRALKQMQKMC